MCPTTGSIIWWILRSDSERFLKTDRQALGAQTHKDSAENELFLNGKLDRALISYLDAWLQMKCY